MRLKMKFKLLKIILSISFMILSVANTFSQDLTINVHDTDIIDSLGSEIIFSIDLKNNTSQDLGVSVVRRENNLLESWSSSLCFDNCFAPYLDSISTSSDFGSSPLAAGETREISLHVFPSVFDGVSTVVLDFINEQNSSEKYSVTFEASTIFVSVNDELNKITDYKLFQNYPNPFNPSTIIDYTIGNKNGASEFVTLKVYDMLGQEVTTLVNRYQTSGNYSVKFNSKNLTSGIYFYELKTDNFSKINKMILEK
jgi:hypothetical protein